MLSGETNFDDFCTQLTADKSNSLHVDSQVEKSSISSRTFSDIENYYFFFRVSLIKKKTEKKTSDVSVFRFGVSLFRCFVSLFRGLVMSY